MKELSLKRTQTAVSTLLSRRIFSLMRSWRGLAFALAALLHASVFAAVVAPKTGAKAMAVTAHPAATRAALSMLRAGGNAVDAAVAAAFVLGVVEPYSSGLGGGGFALVYMKGIDQSFALDFRERAPAAAFRDMYLREGKYDPALSQEGWSAVAIPGQVAGLLHLLETRGRLSREQVLAPAIRAARQGFEVTPLYREVAERSLGKLRRDPAAAEIFLVPGPKGAPRMVPPLGFRLIQNDLAKTLQAISKKGRAAFYEGAVANSMATAAKGGGGLLTRADLKAFLPQPSEPLIGYFRGHEIHSMPLPSSGGITLLETLNILSADALERDGWHAPSMLHLLVEALRRAFADRNTQLGDPKFVEVPSKKLLSAGYAASLRKGIRADQATPSLSLPQRPVPEIDDQRDTSHLSIVDAEGNAVAMTVTINYYFGAGVVAPSTGVLMNDEMDDFAASPGEANIFGLVQGEANAIAPGKVPLSSMTPTLVFERQRDGEQAKLGRAPPGEAPRRGAARRLRYVLGSPGGPRIITTVLQILLDLVVFDHNISEAVSAPRLHMQWLPDRLFVEPGFEAATLKGLRERGHSLVVEPEWSAANCIAIDPKTGQRQGASDPRREGLAEGY